MPHPPASHDSGRHGGRPSWPLRHYPLPTGSSIIRGLGIAALFALGVSLFVVVVVVTTW